MVRILLVVAIIAGGSFFLLRGGWLPSFHQGRSEIKTSSVEIRPVSTTKERNVAPGESVELSITPVKATLSGKEVRMLSYSGSIPGPTLRVKQGSSIHVRLVNNGDGETTMHSHGLRLSNASDGVPGITQDPIPVGGSFVYELSFPDPGIFWYHPHFRQDYGQEMGLYGAIIVEPNDGSYWNAAADERVLMLDDVLLQEDGTLEEFGKKYATNALMGRYGNTLLVNGSINPELGFSSGKISRLFLVNAANARPFRFGIPGVKLRVVGADLGRYDREFFADSVVLGPGERRVVEVMFPQPGSYQIVNDIPSGREPLGRVVVSAGGGSVSEAFPSLRTNVQESEAFSVFSKEYGKKAPDKRLLLDMDMKGMGGHAGHMMSGMDTLSGGIEWEDSMPGMNMMHTAGNTEWKMTDVSTGRSNMDITGWNFKKGDIVKIRIENSKNGMHPMQHPIHFHGQRFIVLSENGKAPDHRAWLDTALIPAGETWDILVEMSNPGEWMAHCHIAEHAESGMMLHFRVEEYVAS